VSAPGPGRDAAGTPADAGTAAPDVAWIALAIELAVENVADGGGPFGAVIVGDGELLATGQNRVTRDHDPTAHAEVCAIRAACAAIGDFSLAGATLYTSCEPCPLCLSASLWCSRWNSPGMQGRASYPFSCPGTSSRRTG
jgi:guanine deaminase